MKLSTMAVALGLAVLMAGCESQREGVIGRVAYTMGDVSGAGGTMSGTAEGGPGSGQPWSGSWRDGSRDISAVTLGLDIPLGASADSRDLQALRTLLAAGNGALADLIAAQQQTAESTLAYLHEMVDLQLSIRSALRDMAVPAPTPEPEPAPLLEPELEPEPEPEPEGDKDGAVVSILSAAGTAIVALGAHWFGLSRFLPQRRGG